eukprot:582929-Rhodomonas_salina.3
MHSSRRPRPGGNEKVLVGHRVQFKIVEDAMALPAAHAWHAPVAKLSAYPAKHTHAPGQSLPGGAYEKSEHSLQNEAFVAAAMGL